MFFLQLITKGLSFSLSVISFNLLLQLLYLTLGSYFFPTFRKEMLTYISFEYAECLLANLIIINVIKYLIFATLNKNDDDA